MKKQKVVILDNEQQNNHDLDAIHKLQDGLSKIDQFPVYTPDLQWFENMVITEKENSRKKLRKELSLFLMIALIILSGIIVSLYQMPIVFLFIQIITTVFIVFYTITGFRKKVKINE
ncbi:YxlC family protein [Neobacillus sp. 3P2-tot-E-2]|uniref:YxlC family protein n=1 Tax=Neobacillus sp. 3P2-tot-E-2 TaxID=3132212 RepID=UPI0039A0E5C6